MIKDSEKYNIICFSNQLWDFPNWTNKKHVMYRLAERGHNVLFVDPPINLGFVFFRQVRRGYWNASRILKQYKIENENGTMVYTPLNLIPKDKYNAILHIKKINNLAKKHFEPGRKTILWIYHIQLLNLFSYVDNIPHDILVYDCVDNYAGFPEHSSFFSTTVSKENLLDQEINLTKKANIVFATAPGLVDRLKAYNANVHFTPNVGDYERFKDVKQLKNKIPEDLKQIPRPRIGYIGALDDYKFDMKLVKKLAEEHPSYSFVIIGPMALKDKEGKLKDFGLDLLENIYFLGSRAYEEKAYYLAGFDIDIIPYILNDYTVGGCFPVKFHDSLAAGLPVVVTDLPAYMPFKDVCYISRDYEEFSKNIELALKEDTPEKIRKRQQVAKENNWDGKVTKMLNLLGDRI